MVGVPVLFMVWVGACWPFTCVMGVVVGVCGWCVFQWCVAVVSASRRVPGVGVCVCVLVCSGVGWLVSCVRVVLACSWCACVVVGSGVKVLWWFRMLTCLASFFFLGFVSCLVLSCLVNNGVAVCGGCGAGCVGWFGPVGLLGCCFLLFVFARCEWCAGVCLWGGVCEWVFLVSVVVWVWGVLSGVACCLCGFVMRLLRVVCRLGLMLVGACLRLVA